MSAEEREVKQHMSTYARQTLAKDARLLDVRFEAESASWVASAVSKGAGVAEIVAVKENGQWRLSSSKSTRRYAREMVGTRVGTQGRGRSLVALAVGALLLGGGYVALPHVQDALKRLPAKAANPSVAPAQQKAGATLNSTLLNAATELADDPARKAAAEQATSKVIGAQGAAQGLGELQRLNTTAAGQRP